MNDRNGFVYERDEGCVTRSRSRFRSLFTHAGLVVHKEVLQDHFPDSMYPVRMFALQ
jgi:hypothetical protein